MEESYFWFEAMSISPKAWHFLDIPQHLDTCTMRMRYDFPFNFQGRGYNFGERGIRVVVYIKIITILFVRRVVLHYLGHWKTKI